MSTFKRPALPSSNTGSSHPLRRRPAPPPSLNSTISNASSSSSLTSPPLQSANGQRSRDPSESRVAAGAAAGAASKREPTDANIQVVVRCRGLSPTETGAGVPVVAQVKATRGTQVKLIDPSPIDPSSSSSNLVATATSASAPAAAAAAPPPNGTTATGGSKTWDFGDRLPEGSKEPRGTVYGPEADQGMLYNDVAKPILQQVLQGYNCTIFAYGQTGTGKTYTMEGNLSPYHGTFHPEAGVIPRTLYSLFDRLVESKCEYSVRCSYIELYNEELRDLNAADPSLVGSTTSSSLTTGGGDSTAAPSPEPGASATGAGGAKTLRIYEETKNGSTGVVIQGLEETVIQSAEDGLRVLRRGSERRQIAATNCNERSSRSHSIFTIHVQVRDNSKEGADVLKVGKLNLVDLAGSENVGRSGATNSRAREAGMINASLLALGRVINQLVDKSDSNKKQHIAYRESKLTRLLQDSLGGRTKTTIIATISPVSYEETASTLTYAHQAKSIQNRPEVNQRVSRNVVLNQFATEIARLQADLQAARGHEGVYVSKETWDSLETGRQNYDDTKQRLEIAESQLQTTRDQFEQNFRLLSTREDQLRKVQEELALVKAELNVTKTELAETKMSLAEQQVLRDAYESSREGWKEAASDALGDVEGLRAKLDRKSEVERANLALIAEAREAIGARTTAIDQQAEQLKSMHGQFVSRMADQLDSFAQRQQAHLATSNELIEQHVDTLAGHLYDLASTRHSADSHAARFREVVSETCARAHRTIRQRALDVEAAQKDELDALVAHLESHREEMSCSVRELSEPVQQLQQDCLAILERNQEILSSLQSEDAAYLAHENARLRAIVEELRALISSEQEQAEAEQAAMLERIRTEIATTSRRRMHAISTTVDHVEREVSQLVSTNSKHVSKRRDQLAGVATAEERLQTRLGVTADAARTLAAMTLWQTASHARAEQIQLLSTAAARVRSAEVANVRASLAIKSAGDSALRGVLSSASDVLGDWKESEDRSDQDIYSTVLMAASDIDSWDRANTSALMAIKQYADSTKVQLQEDLVDRVSRDVVTGTTPGPRERPVDRVLPVADLDADRPTVLERLLAARADAVNAEAARMRSEAAATVLPELAAADARISLARRETPSPVVMRVPLPRAERASLVSTVAGGKDGLKKERVKPPALGERDHNNPSRRLTAAGRRMAKPPPSK
ncbi:hypothetical protein JCM10908_002615 [Rhodotorula pacifica]|uniref:uncharacterized protein n=1 Tax=Rhodotorula pacifica TaxID=1495444 RepID=UPI003173F6D5